MSLTTTPNTPIRTPQLRSSLKTLQLTPIWQEVVKNNRLPSDVNEELIFQEISTRLEDLEWPVRLHACRVLYDIIPIISKERLDERVLQSSVLPKLVLNLGHPAPGMRKVSSETLQRYLRKTSQTEKMLEDFLHYGLKEKELPGNNESGILRENITLGTIVNLVDVLKAFIVPENGGYTLSQSFLTDIVKTLAEKSKNNIYKDKSVETLWKIKDMVGESRFQRTLNNLQDKDYIMNLVNMKTESIWNEETAFGILISQDSFDGTNEQKDEEKKENGSSEDFSDGTDTETYTKEPAPSLDDDAVYYHVNRAEVSHYTPPSFVPIEHSDNYLPKEAEEEKEEKKSGESSPRVVLEAEIQFAKNKAITMKVMEDEKENEETQKRFLTEDGDLVMKVLNNAESIDEEEEERTRTPRRVRFGGEVIKLRTPDSDTTDITIEIHEGDGRKEPTITVTPDVSKPLEKKPEVKIPVGLTTKPPSREPSPSRRVEGSRIPVFKDSYLTTKSESLDSAPSSSGSEGDGADKWNGDEETVWKWTELRLVEENIIKDLKNKENWKIQYQALEQLKIVLINPKTIERIGKMKNQSKLKSLFKCLLHKLPENNNNQQVTALALSIVTQLIETLPKELILSDVKDIVEGLCKYVGGCKNLNLKIEAVQSLKMLFGILEPSAVIDVLIGDTCLFSSSSKIRENSLLAIMYATMTFPSDMFDVEKILEKVSASAADSRRRVRHGALEAIAILSQFSSSQTLTENIARVAEGLSTPGAKTQLIAAVQARLSRRLLPTISNEGLVLYALQIPASRRFGHLGNPMGADVDWILSGTGSVSTGSAKSKTQLNAAQRLELNKPTAPLSPNKWAQSERGPKIQPGKSATGMENPWKIQKHRTETSNSFLKAQSTGNLNEDRNKNYPGLIEPEKPLKPEEITWALVPISALDEPLLTRERSNSLWGDTYEGENYLSPSFGPLRPMYIKLQPTHDQLLFSRSSDDVRRNSYTFGGKKDLEDFTQIRLLTPTILREKNISENQYGNEKTSKSDVPTKIPVLCTKRGPQTSAQNDRKISEPDDTKPSKLSNGFSGSSAFLPSIHSDGHDGNFNLQKSPSSNKFSDVDEFKLQDTMSQLSGLLNASKNVGRPNRDFYYPKSHSDNLEMSEFDEKIQTFDRSYKTLPNTVASAPPAISTEIPSTSSSNSTEFGAESRIRRLTNGSDLENSRNYATYNPKLKGKRILGKNTNKVGINGNPFPETLKPFERPKEGLDTCFNQLESQQWEVNMLGLTSLVRLLRHHPAIVLGQLHPIIVALARQIRNLRSQVARVACQASAEMFVALKRNVEPDLEELSGPLFHRSADTNRFIRADCNQALDNMVDNVGHAKAVSVIISKGTTHQNATVRTVAARLLLRLSEKSGPEKLLSLPKETRDKMLQAGANLLMEGKLETRAFAKQVFRIWSSHSSFSNLILEAVQPNIMRHISKTLVSLKC